MLRRRYEPWPSESPARIAVDNTGDAAVHVARIVSELPRGHALQAGGPGE